jgi:hypothetical protein
VQEHRTTAVASATRNPERPCAWGGPHCPPAVVHDADGSWCSNKCQALDRASETRMWRRWAA